MAASFTWLTTSASQSRIPAPLVLPFPLPSAEQDEFTAAMADMRIGEANAPSLGTRVTHNSPVSSPRMEMIDLFEEAVLPSSSAPAPRKQSKTLRTTQIDDGTPDLLGSRTAPSHSKFELDKRSSSPEKDIMVIDSEEYPSTPLMTAKTTSSVPLAPMKRRIVSAKRDKISLDAAESFMIRQLSDLDLASPIAAGFKKRARNDEEAVEMPDISTKKRRLAMEQLPSAEKKDPVFLQPIEKMIDVTTRLPFCAADQIRMFYNLIIHPVTNIWLGMDGNTGGSGKIVSFLPTQISEDLFKMNLEQAVSSGNSCIVYQGNKGLFQLDLNGTLFEVEVIMVEGKIHSVQPIFHFENYDETKESIRVEYLSQSFSSDPILPDVYELPYSKLLDLVKAHLSAPSFNCPIAYETEDTLFVDVAILDKKCPFSKGLIIAIPKSELENRMSF